MIPATPARLWLVVSGIVSLGLALPAAAQSPDLDRYVFFAEQELRAFGTTITDGALGVNQGRLVASRGLAAPSSDVVADTVRLDSASVCGQLFANVVEKAAAGCAPATPFTSPLVDLRAACGFPEDFPEDCSGEPIDVLKRSHRTLAPGTYAAVRVRNGATLVLEGGTYTFCSLHVSRNGKLLFEAPSQVRVVGDVSFSNATRVAPVGSLSACEADFLIGGARLTIQRNAEVQGRYCAPSADLNVDHRGAPVGRFAARFIKLGHITARRVTSQGCFAGGTTTTTSTTTSSSSSTAPASTTTTTLGGAVCGNGIREGSEECDPPGSFTCPGGSPGGAFMCDSECTCGGLSTTTTTTTVGGTTSTTGASTTTTTVGTTSTSAASTTTTTGAATTSTTSASTTTTTSLGGTTTTTIPGADCGNGIKEPGEQCDGDDFGGSNACPPGSPTGAFVNGNGAQLICTPECRIDTSQCPGGDRCGDGLVSGPEECDGEDVLDQTCASLGLPPGTLRCTPQCLLDRDGCSVVAEICNNCLDDDANGLADFEDPSCCQQLQRFEMRLSRGRIRARGAKSRLRLKARLAVSGLGDVNPRRQDVFLQIRPEGGIDILCAMVPAEKFMKMHGAFKSWDRKHLVTSARGLDDMAIKVKRSGRVRFQTVGRRVEMPTPPPGRLQVTVGFHDPATGDAGNRCSVTTQAFRTSRGGALRAP
jgi:hypothetical protein